MSDRVYLDWNATTPLRPEARAAMAAAFELCGNASSVHSEGRKARHLIEDARAAVAQAVGATARHVVFTSGGTEANALALSPGLRAGSGAPVERLLVSAIEHASVLAGGRFPAAAITRIAVTPAGIIDLDALRAALRSGPPALVSVMVANNETGVVQLVAEVAETVHHAGGLLHVDAIQAFTKIPFSISDVKADLATLSAHKIGGPQGVGALILAEGVTLEPLLRGGGQERGRRAGTENVAGIAGFGAAVRAAMSNCEADAARMLTLRDRLETGLREGGLATVIAQLQPRLPNTTLFIAPVKAEIAVIGFDLEGIAVSSGSACSSGKVRPSHVLEAMGLGPEMAQLGVRLSLGWSTTDADIDRCLQAWRKLAGTLVKGEPRNPA